MDTTDRQITQQSLHQTVESFQVSCLDSTQTIDAFVGGQGPSRKKIHLLQTIKWCEYGCSVESVCRKTSTALVETPLESKQPVQLR